ncbi:MAG: hypothetical protein COV07_00435 [Candidatus Vogelbacteria bacterium CG10_big_fil_rev_8_21_14_0_10_45_14]|uniref:Peptidoglycan binding-like domain-containing protein n=1 Tax=Candidatus Vogelbacteria bacterium CG10_big_fil_rev_8_21_14_0_10_45_14 TaxID=1975042 RepID=A0A2H0RKS2_9BACT|nr:MAG: hypothetical protein COV07_00435 [Candidatus Vogelbacteria bacterium CG10_big_fil_rev_8_21_14_0_10_45_14]
MNNIISMQWSKKDTAYFVGATSVAIIVAIFLLTQSASAAITAQLDMGDRGTEVTELQVYLAANPSLYPSGLVTGYFGQLTKAGVERFQTLHGIASSGTPATTGYGRVGPRTISALNLRLGGMGADVHAPSITSVNVSTGTNSAAVAWGASEMARGKLYYSTSPLRLSNTFDATGFSSGEIIVNGTLASYDGIAKMSHLTNIDGLTPNTTYYYLALVLDASNNVSITKPAFFVTTQ